MDHDRPSTPDDVKALVQERGIRFIRLWFTDILGQLSTFAILPWRPAEDDGGGVARMFADVQTPEREPYEGDPRHVLRRAVQRAESMGFEHFFVGPELEYFLFRDNRGTEVLDEGGYFDLTTLDAGSDVRRDTVLALERFG